MAGINALVQTWVARKDLYRISLGLAAAGSPKPAVWQMTDIKGVPIPRVLTLYHLAG